MLSFYLIWSLSYFILLVWLSRFWPAESENKTAGLHGEVTLLIPFRNEINHTEKLATSVKNLSKQAVHVLLIDDHSDDGSCSFLWEKLKGFPHVKVVSSPLQGKKAALEYGVSLAQTDLILCSDADCAWPESWLHSMLEPFKDPSIQFVAGPVMVRFTPAFLHHFQQLDWASILLLTQFGFAKQNPLMCSGANLAYRKSAFESVGGYAGNRRFSSGDDEFLLKKIVGRFGAKSCAYRTHPDALVLTGPEATWDALLRQRFRWAGKWRAKDSLANGLVAVLMFLVQVIWIGSIGLLVFGSRGILTFMLLWMVKVAAEKLALGKVLSSFEIQISWIAMLKTTFIHPFYAVVVGLGALEGKFTWKGRQNARSVNLESEI